MNSPAFGNYSDYLCDELTAFVDENFRTHKSPEFRAIVGHSSGGYGALMNAIKRPDRFLFVGSSAADSFFEVSILPAVKMMVDEIEKSGGVIEFMDEFLNSPNPMKLSRSKGETMMNLSLAPCYAPNLNIQGLYGDIFFDLKTGAIIPEIWKKYLACDPIHFIPNHSSKAQKLKFILLDSGKQDEYGLQLGQRQIAEVLKKIKVPHEVLEYSGGHGGHNWRFGERLKIILGRMAA